ncbi:MAG: hypothetical protein JXR72_02160 [Proteobacteria bacterium]|nr:hypothetical protein [Pseudomonadota bacterium]
MATLAKTIKSHRTKLSAVAAILFILFSGPTPKSLLIGLPFIIAGEAVRMWSSGHINKSSVLAVRGPYSLSRNPLYVGSFILGSGFMVAMADPRVTAVFFLFFGFVYWFTIRWEESKLSRLFPDQWATYSCRVPKVLPLRRIPEYRKGEFLWSQVFRNREHANAAAVVLVYVILWLKAVF